MKTLATLSLCGLLTIGAASPAAAFTDDNPFVEAMLRMMEVFGLIDRSRLPLGVPYLPSYGGAPMGGIGGLPGLGGMPGMSSPWSMGGMPGMTPMPGMGTMPGMGSIPGGMGPGGGLPAYLATQGWYGQGGSAASSGYMDGIWELTNGSFVVIKRHVARLHLDDDRFQDFTIGYDRQYFWWTPRNGNTTSHYRYQMRDGRMILRDNQGKVLLMRRRS